MYENDGKQEDNDVNVYTHTVKITPEISIIKNKVVPKGTKVEFKPEKLEKLVEEQEKPKEQRVKKGKENNISVLIVEK